ncbi:MAG TPA: ABC transporter substrate-binding protein [Clostridiales bacterium]|nr:ABC transporter substrate-binding protein [Clostridiales bacterium]
MCTKKILAILMTLVLVFGLAACGGSSTSPASSAPASSASQAALSTSPASSVPSQASSQSSKSNKLVVYTALNEDDIVTIQKEYKELTGIEIEHIRLGGGDLAARVQAEMANPKADVMVGGSVDLYDPLGAAGAFEKYTSPNTKDIDPMFVDPNGYWNGWYMGVLGLVINTERFDKELAPKGLERPKTWDDLLDERYKDVFVTSNPATAGGGYIFCANQIFRLGEEGGKEYLKNLDKVVHHYYKGAGDCISPVATGEFIVGMSWVHDIFKTQKQGYPIEIVIPEKTAFEIGGAALVKGGPNPENGKAFIDWLLTKEAGELNRDIANRYSVRKDVAAPQGLPAIEEVDLVDYDRAKAGDMKTTVVEWFEKEITANRG